MAQKSRDPERSQAPGYYSEGDGIGDTLHVREELLIDGLAKPPKALVVRLYHDRWVTTAEDWKGTNR